ncbi:MAG: BlaI/MecI/CopY family transcriptional regulator, partial [Planctomycetota bacterium]
SAPKQARHSALRHLLRTFFNDSIEDAVAALLDVRRGKIDDEQLLRLKEMIEEVQKSPKKRDRGS